MIYKNLITLQSGRKALVALKSFLYVFKTEYNDDIIAEANCVTLMAGFKTDQGIKVDGCLKVI